MIVVGDAEIIRAAQSRVVRFARVAGGVVVRELVARLQELVDVICELAILLVTLRKNASKRTFVRRSHDRNGHNFCAHI